MALVQCRRGEIREIDLLSESRNILALQAEPEEIHHSLHHAQGVITHSTAGRETFIEGTGKNTDMMTYT